MEELLYAIKLRLPEITGHEKDTLLCALLEDAQSAVCAYIGQDTLPHALQSAVVRLAVVYYNRLGMEGEISHAEGEMHMQVESLPQDIKQMLQRYRRVKTVS